MNHGTKLFVTVALLTVLTGLGAADYVFQGDDLATLLPPRPADSNSDTPQHGVAKHTGMPVRSMVEASNLTVQEKGEASLLAQIAEGESVESIILLADGDRAGALTWVDSPRVKTLFIALKDALLTSFSSQVRDVQDETLQPGSGPVVNRLAFLDPALSEERVVFVRVRERLYEFHIAAQSDALIQPLIEAVSSGK